MPLAPAKMAWRAWARQVPTLHDDATTPGRHCCAVSDGGTLDTSLWDCELIVLLTNLNPKLIFGVPLGYWSGSAVASLRTWSQLCTTDSNTATTSCQLSFTYLNNSRSTHTCLTALFRDYPGEPVRERKNKSGFYWSKRQWVAVTSAGLYASLHLAPDRKPHQHPTTLFFYRPDALPAT